MSLVCTTVTTWIKEEVLKPVMEWVSETKKECKKLSKWNPLRWFCWLVTTLIQITVWIVEYISIPIFTTTCLFVSYMIYWILKLIAIIIAALTQNYTMLDWVEKWFHTNGKISNVTREDDPGGGGYLYKYTCNCNYKSHDMQLVAPNDDEAALKMEMACIEKCKG